MIKINVIKKLMTAEGPLELDINMEVKKGEFITLFGKSGSGKTTILRMIAGLTEPDEGFISADGQVWFDSAKKINVPAGKRRTGFVFQEYSLFPNMTVRQNMEYALDDNKNSRQIDELLEMAHVKELENRRPDQLSGGQKQRVALIRALLRDARIYLLDEPLAALDIEMRLRLQEEILRLYRNTSVTAIFVSHDLAEVFKLTGRVCVLDGGKIIKAGSPEKVFSPAEFSGKFKFPGEIIEIKKDQGMNVLTVLIGNNMVKVVATNEELRGMSVGSRIIVASKAFNPVIIKYEHP